LKGEKKRDESGLFSNFYSRVLVGFEKEKINVASSNFMAKLTK